MIDIRDLQQRLNTFPDNVLEGASLHEEAADALARLDAALDPKQWTQEMSDAWHLNSDLNKAFEALRAAACGKLRQNSHER